MHLGFRQPSCNMLEIGFKATNIVMCQLARSFTWETQSGIKAKAEENKQPKEEFRDTTLNRITGITGIPNMSYAGRTTLGDIKFD